MKSWTDLPCNPLCGGTVVPSSVSYQKYSLKNEVPHMPYTEENEDAKWIRSNYEVLQEKYSDMYTAVFKKKVIAASNSFNDMRERAKRDK